MILIPQDQALQRWDVLPATLREALSSEANTDFLLKTCASENIFEPKVYTVSRIAGYVLLGFLHPEDVAQELVDALKIDPKTAKSVQDALNGRIFAPLRTDINKVYAPLSNYTAPSTSIAGPKVIQDVSEVSFAPYVSDASVALPKAISGPTLPTVGWSQMKPPAPTPPPPAASPRPAVTIPAPTPSAGIKPSAPVPPPTRPATPAEPAPVMLHEDTTFKAAQKNVAFTLSRPGGGAEMHMGSGGAVPTPPRPAVLEFGGGPKPATTPAVSSGAVHYTDFKSPLSSAPTANSGPRNVVQMTSPAAAPKSPSTSASAVPVPQPPKPPQPPRPLQSPTPPTPPAAPQNNKPIVKDFL